MSKILVSGMVTSEERETLASLCNEFRQQLHADLQAETASDLDSVQAEYAAVDRLSRACDWHQ